MKMERLSPRYSFIALAVAAAVFGCAPASKDAAKGAPAGSEKQGAAKSDGEKVYELSFAGLMPPSSPWETKVMAPYLEEIGRQTNGRVKITTYPGGTLLEGGKIYDGVATGVADMGHESLSWVNGRFLVSDILKKSGVPFKSGEAASRTFKDLVAKLDPKEYHDVKVLMLICTGPGNLHTVKPVRALQDLNGMEIRCIGSDAPSLTALGAKPVSMSHQDGYEALQKGIVQGTLASDETLQTWHNAEVTKFTTRTPFMYNGLQAVVMNLDSWQKLPKDIQDGIQRASDKIWEDIVVHFYDNESAMGLKYAVEKTGQTVIDLSPEETARWQEKIAHILDHYADELDAKGLPGKDAKKLLFEYGDKYNTLHKSAPTKVAQAK